MEEVLFYMGSMYGGITQEGSGGDGLGWQCGGQGIMEKLSNIFFG